ncbi:hypothetical protein SAZ11_05730 [Streptomyces sp. FXJ1.4098]|nr:hypothetical protein [Streptomyces sp. FXJ1.4098]
MARRYRHGHQPTGGLSAAPGGTRAGLRPCAPVRGRLDWLTVAQREEVERLYAQDQWDLTEQNLHKVARRAEELRAEYQGIYRRLRLRLLVAALLGGVALTIVATTLAAG